MTVNIQTLGKYDVVLGGEKHKTRSGRILALERKSCLCVFNCHTQKYLLGYLWMRTVNGIPHTFVFSNFSMFHILLGLPFPTFLNHSYSMQNKTIFFRAGEWD